MNFRKRKLRKVFLLFTLIFITAVSLIFETYSWFVGMSSVSTDTFDISISSSGGLELSLDGSNWSSTTLTVNQSAIENAYSGNSNKWTVGLEPISTNGLLDTTTSKLNFYQKSSLSATPGGYRIVADKISNSTTEGEGYVAFDLFVRNKTGSGYDSSYNEAAAEDIYLTADSNVKVPINQVTNYGLQNSIRVGFFEIGRVQVGSSVSTVRGLTCSSSPNLCANTDTLYLRRSYTWNIWEPNNAHHSTNLIAYFNQICRKRNTSGDYTNDLCPVLESGTGIATYSLKSELLSSDNVDIYDGGRVNGYGNFKLANFLTYKTTFATSTGDQKPALLRVAANSITKVRVYIWLEGQDIDNFDLITQDQKVTVNFGLTKDRYGLNENNVNNPSTGRSSSFEDDSWALIKANVHAGTTSQYKVGDTRQIVIGSDVVTLRLANKSSPSDICGISSNSETACGFVVEFANGEHSTDGGLGPYYHKKMNTTNSNVGGWPGSSLYTYLQGDFYNRLPSDLKEIISPTRVVSGYGTGGSSNYITNDKLYLLSEKEVYNNNEHDTAGTNTRQLDYYHNNGVTMTNYSMAGKLGVYGDVTFLRNAYAGTNNWSCVGDGGVPRYGIASCEYYVAPAFRIT